MTSDAFTLPRFDFDALNIDLLGHICALEQSTLPRRVWLEGAVDAVTAHVIHQYRQFRQSPRLVLMRIPSNTPGLADLAAALLLLLELHMAFALYQDSVPLLKWNLVQGLGRGTLRRLFMSQRWRGLRVELLAAPERLVPIIGGCLDALRVLEAYYGE